MTKNKKIGIIAVIVCLLAVLGLSIALIFGGSDGSGETVPTTTNSDKTAYTVRVKTEGGMALEGVGVYVYTDASRAELVWFDKTNADGEITFTDVTLDTMVAVLNPVPDGYVVEEEYPITGAVTEIVLKGAGSAQENFEDMTFSLGDLMWDFTVTAVDGTEYTLSQMLQEKEAVVLNFWFVQCQPCVSEFPHLQAAYEKYSDSIELLGMNPVNSDEAQIIQFGQEHGLTFPLVACGPEWEKIMQLTAYPTTVIIDRYGMITLIHEGSVTESKVFEDAFAFFTDPAYEQTVVEDIMELETEPEGTIDNPQELGGVTSFEVTVEAGQVHYIDLYKAIDMYLQIRSENAYVICNDKTYYPTNGVVTVPVSCPDTYTPVKIGIGNSGDETETFKATLSQPYGSMGNPYPLELGEFTTNVSAGNDQGVYYRYTATEAGVLTLECLEVTAGVNYEYILYNLTSYAFKTLQYDSEDGKTLSVNVRPGDSVQVSMNTLPDGSNNYPAGTFRSLATFTAGEVEEDDEAAEKLTYSVTVLASDGTPVPGVAMKLEYKQTEDETSTGETPEPQVLTTGDDGVASAELPKGTYTVTVTVPAGYTADMAVLELTAEAPTAQVQLAEKVVEMVDYTVTVLDPEGKPMAGIQVIVDGTSQATDAQGKAAFRKEKGSYEALLIAPEGYVTDSTSYPFPEDAALTVTLQYQPGSQGNPIEVTAVPFTTQTIPAGSELYYNVYNIGGMILNIGDADAYVTCGDKTYTADTNGVVVLEIPAGHPRIPTTLAIGNLGSEPEQYYVTAEYPLGSMGNPETVENTGSVETELASGDSDGYCYSWTASEAGTLTVFIESVELQDTDVTASADLMLTSTGSASCPTLSADGVYDPATGITAVSMDVEAGDVVTISVYLTDTIAYPGAKITLNLAFLSNAEKYTIEITTQPQSVSAQIGQSVSFALEAKGYGLSYQWQAYKASTDSWVAAGETGAATNTLTLQATLALKDSRYRCVITNAFGDKLVSQEAALQLQAAQPLAITLQPQSVSALAGDTVTFTVEATGENVTYQWQQYNKTYDEWTNIDGGTANTLTVEATTALNATQYRCVLVDAINDRLITEQVTLLVEDKLTLAITAQPQSVWAYAGETVSFTVEANGNGLTYLWQCYDAAGGWMDTAAAENTLRVEVTGERSGTQYRCVITDVTGASVTTDVATLAVITDAITIHAQPADITAVVGETVSLTVEAEGENLSYQWQHRSGRTGVWTDVSEAVSAGMSVEAILELDGSQYRCVITDGSGSSLISREATLNVGYGAPVAIVTHPADVTAFVGDGASFTVAATGYGLHYQWQSYDAVYGTWAALADAPDSATLTLTVTTELSGSRYRCVITDISGNVAVSNGATLTAKEKQPAEIMTQPKSVAVYAGKSAEFTIEATGDGLRYQWQQRASSAAEWADVQGATAAALTLEAQLSMNGWQYRCVVAGDVGDAAVSAEVTLTVRAPVAITGQPSAAAVTEGETATFTVAAAGYGLRYQWQLDSGSGWTAIDGATAAAMNVTAALEMNGWQYRCVVTDAGENQAVSAAAVLTVQEKVQKATYTVTVTDYAGAPAAGITVVFQGTGANTTAVTNASGVAKTQLVQDHYTVSLVGTDAFYEKSTAVLTPSQTQLTILLASELTGQTVSMYMSDSGEAHEVGIGGTHVVLGSTGDSYSTETGLNFFAFNPTQAGSYRFTTSNPNAKISFWGSNPYFFIQQTGAVDAHNAFTQNIQAANIGGTWFIGIEMTGDTTECALIITRLGDPDYDPVYEPWVPYTGSQTPTKFTYTGGSLTYVDVTGATEDFTLIYNESDGYYHLGAVDGPVMYVNLGPNAPNISLDLMINGDGTAGGTGFRASYYDSYGELVKEDYTELMQQYISCVDTKTGVYPLTKDLAYMFRMGAENQGWTDSTSPSYLFKDADGNIRQDVNPDICWMFACCYEA